MSELTDKAEYLLNYYKDEAPVFPIGSYEYRAMADIIEALHKLEDIEDSEGIYQ